MEQLILSAALVLTAVLLNQILGKQGKDFSVLLSLTVCCLVLLSCLELLRPVLTFLETLENKIPGSGESIQLLLRCVGMGVVTEIAVLTCSDAGEQMLGKILQLVGTVALLYMSLPLLQALLELTERILGKL